MRAISSFARMAGSNSGLQQRTPTRGFPGKPQDWFFRVAVP